MRNMRGSRCYAGREQQAVQFARSFLHKHPGVLRREGAATRKTHDIVQKPHTSLHAAVLVVDLRVAMPHVRAVDQIGRRLIHGRGPAAQTQAAQIRRGFVVAPHQAACRDQLAQVRQRRLHKHPWKAAEACFGEAGLQLRGRQQQLRLDALHAWGVLQHRQEMSQQNLLHFDLARTAREQVTHDSLLRFVHGKGVAMHPPGMPLHRNEPWKDALVQVPDQQFDGLRVVPQQIAPPHRALFGQQRAQIAPRMKAQVADVITVEHSRLRVAGFKPERCSGTTMGTATTGCLLESAYPVDRQTLPFVDQQRLIRSVGQQLRQGLRVIFA